VGNLGNTFTAHRQAGGTSESRPALRLVGRRSQRERILFSRVLATERAHLDASGEHRRALAAAGLRPFRNGTA
jgi:hypothetical protein